MNETQLIQSKQELPVSFYEQLDLIVKNERSTKQAFERAVEIGRSYGLSDEEIAQTMKDYLKEVVPKSTLHRWTQPLFPNVPSGTIRREESSSQFVETEQSDLVDVTEPVENDKTEYTPEFQSANKVERGITHVKLSDAITILLNARRDGAISGNFFWESDSK